MTPDIFLEEFIKKPFQDVNRTLMKTLLGIYPEAVERFSGFEAHCKQAMKEGQWSSSEILDNYAEETLKHWSDEKRQSLFDEFKALASLRKRLSLAIVEQAMRQSQSIGNLGTMTHLLGEIENNDRFKEAKQNLISTKVDFSIPIIDRSASQLSHTELLETIEKNRSSDLKRMAESNEPFHSRVSFTLQWCRQNLLPILTSLHEQMINGVIKEDAYHPSTPFPLSAYLQLDMNLQETTGTLVQDLVKETTEKTYELYKEIGNQSLKELHRTVRDLHQEALEEKNAAKFQLAKQNMALLKTHQSNSIGIELMSEQPVISSLFETIMGLKGTLLKHLPFSPSRYGKLQEKDKLAFLHAVLEQPPLTFDPTHENLSDDEKRLFVLLKSLKKIDAAIPVRLALVEIDSLRPWLELYTLLRMVGISPEKSRIEISLNWSKELLHHLEAIWQDAHYKKWLSSHDKSQILSIRWHGELQTMGFIAWSWHLHQTSREIFLWAKKKGLNLRLQQLGYSNLLEGGTNVYRDLRIQGNSVRSLDLSSSFTHILQLENLVESFVAACFHQQIFPDEFASIPRESYDLFNELATYSEKKFQTLEPKLIDALAPTIPLLYFYGFGTAVKQLLDRVNIHELQTLMKNSPLARLWIGTIQMKLDQASMKLGKAIAREMEFGDEWEDIEKEWLQTLQSIAQIQTGAPPTPVDPYQSKGFAFVREVSLVGSMIDSTTKELLFDNLK